VRNLILLHLHKNPFEESTGQKTQYYVGVLKDKRTGKNGLEFLLGWCDCPHSKYDTQGPITNLPVSENMIAEFNNKWEEDYKFKGTSIRV
jgi:hypothetical protein